MHVDRRVDAVLAQRLADERADREIRDVVVVHDVEVDEVGAGRDDGVDLLAEAREVGRQDRRGYPAVTHTRLAPAMRDIVTLRRRGSRRAITLPRNAALSTNASAHATATVSSDCR